MEKYVTKFYVTNLEGRVGLDPNMYDVTLLDLFFLKASLMKVFPIFTPTLEWIQEQMLTSRQYQAVKSVHQSTSLAIGKHRLNNIEQY